MHASRVSKSNSTCSKKSEARWLGGTRQRDRIIASGRHSDSQTARHLTFDDALRSRYPRTVNDISWPYFSLFPALSVSPVTKTPTTPLYESYASFTDGVRRVMPLKRFLFRSPFPANTYAPCPILLLLFRRLLLRRPPRFFSLPISLDLFSFDAT